MNTIRGDIRSRPVLLLLTLLNLLLRELPLPLKDLLSLNGREEVMGLQVFRVVMAHTLFLHLSELLWQMLAQSTPRFRDVHSNDMESSRNTKETSERKKANNGHRLEEGC